MTKDDAKARAAFTAARAEQEKLVHAHPDDAGALSVLGLIDAALGRKEEALREGRRAIELLPVEKDAMNGARIMVYLAMIAAWVGDNDLACEQLANAIRVSDRSQLRPIETTALLGPVARRSVLRKNRRLPRAEIKLTTDCTDNTEGRAYRVDERSA